ncbi:MAG: type III pantothenate kinase [Bacteroidales bacterium]
MNLTVDIGNSLTKMAVFEGKTLQRLLTVRSPEQDYFLLLLDEFPIDKCIISSVQKHQEEDFEFLPENITRHIVTKDTRLPFTNVYKSPETLGNDRKALVSGGVSLFPGKSILIISAGTAITYDFVDKSGTYYGGAISPGIYLRFKSLNTFTGKLPLAHYQNMDEVTGKTTEQSIASGVMTGITGEILHFINLYQTKIKNLTIILTGGDAKHFDKTLKNNIFAIPNLTLVGLNEIMELNV